jgi:hypothetical protein
MLPANECLDTGNSAAHQADFGLVVEQKLTALQSMAQIGSNDLALRRVKIYLVFEE